MWKFVLHTILYQINALTYIALIEALEKKVNET